MIKTELVQGRTLGSIRVFDLGAREERLSLGPPLECLAPLARSHSFNYNSTSPLDKPLQQNKWLLAFFTHLFWSSHHQGEDLQANINIYEARNELGSELAESECFVLVCLLGYF